MKDKIGNISSFTSQTIHELRDTIWAMNKNEISLEDLQARILSFTQKAKTAVPQINFTIHNNVNTNEIFSSVVGINIFRVVQEAINNAIKYADAKNIEVNLEFDNQLFTASILDDGKGFDLQTVTLGNGLSNMEKRMSEIGGKIIIDSKPNKGTIIKLSLKTKANNV
ncbi:MAG: hypothetical protein HC798_02135 [Polaribacter sp.]|nr:hypothetical protein [Polaribacter sp.]